jgi:hypothetical protein
MHYALNLVRQNNRLARRLWGKMNRDHTSQLRELTNQNGFSISRGDLTMIGGKWYVTHSGLLAIARRKRCIGIQTEIQPEYSDAKTARWVFKATVFTTPRSKGFVGFGDADPSNVSPLVRGAELRIAETRAVNRALRKAYGIGLCSVEELGAGPTRIAPDPISHCGNGQPRLRDRLLLLIRQHQLDAEQVKRYAAHFCGTTSLREASREQIENLLDHLTALAAQGGDKLVAELQSARDSQPEEAAARNLTAEAAAAERKEAA